MKSQTDSKDETAAALWIQWAAFFVIFVLEGIIFVS